MSDLSQGQQAKVPLNPGQVLRVSAPGSATVTGLTGAPSGPTTINASTQDFGPYSVPAVLRVAATTGTASYGLVQWSAVTRGTDGKLYADGVAVSTSAAASAAGGPIPALRRWYQAVAGRDYAAAVCVGIGDSWMEDRTVLAFGQQFTQLLPKRLRARLPTAGIGAGGGIGYVSIQNVSIFAPYASPWTTTGAPTQSFTSGGLGLKYTIFGAGQSAIITVTGTHAVIHYLKGNSSRIGYYKIDGGAAVTFETNNGVASDDGFLVVNLGASGSHTLEVGYSSGGQVYIAGGAFFDGDFSSGLQFYLHGHTAYRTTDYLSTAPGGAAHMLRIKNLNPHLVIIWLGQNDFAQGAGLFISAAQYKANLQSIIASLRALGVTASFLIITSADTTAIKNAGQTSTWAQFVQAARDVAAEDLGGPDGGSGVAHLAMSDPGRIPASTGAAGNGWYDAGAHVDRATHSWITDIITPVLIPA